MTEPTKVVARLPILTIKGRRASVTVHVLDLALPDELALAPALAVLNQHTASRVSCSQVRAQAKVALA